MARAEGDLSGRRAFVVEDDALVTMFIQDTLGEIGCEVTGVASNYKDAIEKAKSLSFDVAILDLNLNGQTSFAIADLLSERRMPFVFSTGYDTATLPAQFQSVPVLHKPWQKPHMERALLAALADPNNART
jgi:CheY-like chemotaxis protein